MTARITIQSGVTAGNSHFIEGRVARVGSDPSSDVCLPSANVPEHALTLEFRDDACRVYNRCPGKIYIGAIPVEPDQVVDWPENATLRMGTDVELLLDFNAEVPASLPDYHDDEYDSFEENDESSSTPEPRAVSKSGSGKTMMQLGVTILCLVGCALLLVRDQSRKSTSASGSSFAEIVAIGIESDYVADNVLQRIQYAEAQRVRGHKKAAKKEFQRVRDELIARIDTNADNTGNPYTQMLTFVQSRLGNDRIP